MLEKIILIRVQWNDHVHSRANQRAEKLNVAKMQYVDVCM